MGEIFVGGGGELAEDMKCPQVGVQLALVTVLDDGEAIDGGDGFGEFPLGSTARVVLAEGLVEKAGFDGPEAADTPTGDGDVNDRFAFDGVAGLEAVELPAEEPGEVVGGFGFEDYAIGIKAVGEAIAGGTQLSLGCFRAAGERAVGPRGSNSNS